MLREDHPYIGFHDRYDSSAVRKRTLPYIPCTVGVPSALNPTGQAHAEFFD